MELLREEKPISQLSAEYGVHKNQLIRWRQQVTDNMSQLFTAGDNWKKEKDEYEKKIDELYTEIGRLSTQIAWFKKKGINVE